MNGRSSGQRFHKWEPLPETGDGDNLFDQKRFRALGRLVGLLSSSVHLGFPSVAGHACDGPRAFADLNQRRLSHLQQS